MNYRKLLSGCLPGKSGSSGPASAVVLALAGGIILGSVVALLFAPASGEETREKLRDGAKDLANGAKDKLQNIKHKLHAGKEELAGNMSNKFSSGKN